MRKFSAKTPSFVSHGLIYPIKNDFIKLIRKIT